MWKNLASIVVAAGIIAAAVVLYKNRHQLFRPDFDRTGGTLLVFEIDGKPPADGLDGLVTALQRRFDASGAAGVVVRADGDRRVILGVPSGKQHDEQVDAIKRLAARPGMLQFRIVANSHDDEEAFKAAVLPVEGLELDVPPPSPRNAWGGDEFTVKLPGAPDHRYRWVEMSEAFVKELNLDSTALLRANPLQQSLVEKSIRTGAGFSPERLSQGLAQARQLPAWSDPMFFVLVREPARGQEVPTDALENVKTIKMPGQSMVQFRVGREGGERFHEMTRHNTVTEDGSFHRNLAILLDGQVLSAPVLYGGIQREISLTGNFSPAEAEDIVILLRGGPLPCRLNPELVLETNRKPK